MSRTYDTYPSEVEHIRLYGGHNSMRFEFVATATSLGIANPLISKIRAVAVPRNDGTGTYNLYVDVYKAITTYGTYLATRTRINYSSDKAYFPSTSTPYAQNVPETLNPGEVLICEANNVPHNLGNSDLTGIADSTITGAISSALLKQYNKNAMSLGNNVAFARAASDNQFFKITYPNSKFNMITMELLIRQNFTGFGMFGKIILWLYTQYDASTHTSNITYRQGLVSMLDSSLRLDIYANCFDDYDNDIHNIEVYIPSNNYGFLIVQYITGTDQASGIDFSSKLSLTNINQSAVDTSTMTKVTLGYVTATVPT